MNRVQIQEVMAIARPAIISLYGRQSLKLSAYNIMESKEWVNENHFITPISIWIQVRGKTNSFKLKIYKGKVESISVGTLNL